MGNEDFSSILFSRVAPTLPPGALLLTDYSVIDQNIANGEADPFSKRYFSTFLFLYLEFSFLSSGHLSLAVLGHTHFYRVRDIHPMYGQESLDSDEHSCKRTDVFLF